MIINLLQVEKLGHREAESLAQGHTVVTDRAGTHTLAATDFRRKGSLGTSLIVQWLGICLAKQGSNP